MEINPATIAPQVSQPSPKAHTTSKPLIASISIKNMLKPDAGSRVTRVENFIEPANQEPPNQEVSQSMLNSAWANFASMIENENPRLFSIITNQQPKLVDGKIIELLLWNSAQEKEIEANSNSLLQFLKSKLANTTLELKLSRANEQGADVQKKAYTASEKFQAMLKANPALAQLKQTLDLEID